MGFVKRLPSVCLAIPPEKSLGTTRAHPAQISKGLWGRQCHPPVLDVHVSFCLLCSVKHKYVTDQNEEHNNEIYIYKQRTKFLEVRM